MTNEPETIKLSSHQTSMYKNYRKKPAFRETLMLTTLINPNNKLRWGLHRSGIISVPDSD